METPVILDGVRTPFGRIGGELADYRSWELAAMAIKATCETLNLKDGDVGELILGVALISSGVVVPARRAAFDAGLPQETPSVTVDRACCSGMTAIGLAAQKIALGERDLIIAGGMESMSQTPWLLRIPRTGGKARVGNLSAEDLLLMYSPISEEPISKYVGDVALSYGVDRQMQDGWAVESHRRYFKALEKGNFADEIRVQPQGRSGNAMTVDEHPRRDTTVERLAALKTVYGSPTVTAGNAPGLNDGASVTVIASETYAKAHGLTPLGRIVGYASTAGAPNSSAYLPALTIADLLRKAGANLSDIGVIEINEAFAATAMVSLKVLAGDDQTQFDCLREKTNVNGGAVAIGHPAGASGSRITNAALREARRRGASLAVASICGGYGQADAILMEAM